jgi:oligoendopeptidase F
MSTSSAEGIRWDLNDLFSSHDDPWIEATLNDCQARAEASATRFLPLMEHSETLTADALFDAIKELEIIYEALGRVGSYAGLLYAADTANADYPNLE